jgi:hypothetical protein
MTKQTSRKMLRNFRRNRKGTAEVIGSILFIIIILFFFTNVYLWHDQATKQMNTALSNKMNSLVSLTASDGSLIVTNQGGVAVALSRLWINDGSQHFFVDLEKIPNGEKITLQAGQSKVLELDTSSGGSPPTVHWDTSAKTARIQYTAQNPSVTCKILAVNGNTASCSYPANISPIDVPGGLTAVLGDFLPDYSSFQWAQFDAGKPDTWVWHTGPFLTSNTNIVIKLTAIYYGTTARVIDKETGVFFMGSSGYTSWNYISSLDSDGNLVRCSSAGVSITPLSGGKPVILYFGSTIAGSDPTGVPIGLNGGNYLQANLNIYSQSSNYAQSFSFTVHVS